MSKWLVTYIQPMKSYIHDNVNQIYCNKIITCDTEYPTESKLREEFFKWNYAITFMNKLSD